MARRTTPEDIALWLVELGADPGDAATIVAVLSRAELSPAQMRRWIKPEQNYSIDSGRRIQGVPWRTAALFLIEDGRADLVIEAAEEFADATPTERWISSTLCGRHLDEVRRLTREDPDRTERVRAVLTHLLAQLRTPTRVDECLCSTFPSGDWFSRPIDCLLDDRFAAMADLLLSDDFDPWQHLERGMLSPAWW